ncbi:helix-turn-helix domain-containing protein [Brevibacillus borstelensis]|uniref:helix-turn-helix domain-containing protein n=1 Tax=Brevibacillus borstelensis TaxID=45462 RepID=UPI0030C4009D
MSISDSIKNFLHAEKLTPSDLARMTGYTPQYIHEILSGKKRWNETTIQKTCEALGLEISVTKRKEDEIGEKGGVVV